MSSVLKTIVLSGASSGIGRCIAEQLLNQGYQVIGLARYQKQPPIDHPQFVPIKTDMSDIVEFEASIKSLVNDESITGVICSAGYGKFNALEQFSRRDMQRMMDVNFLSQALLIKTCLPVFKRNRVGHIVVIGSEAALQGAKQGSLYCASKFALRGFTQSLRAECATANIAVSLINPGFVATPFFDDLHFRPGDDTSHTIQPQQVADWVCTILHTEPNVVIEEVNLQPLKKVIQHG